MDDEVGGEEGGGVGNRLHRSIVGRHIKQPLVAGAREIGEQQRQETVRCARQRERRRCRRNRGEYIGGRASHGSGI